MIIKPGIKTTEFWHTAVAQLLSLLVLVGFITANDSRTLEEALGKVAGAVVALFFNGKVVVEYIKGRMALKASDNGAAPPSQAPTVLPSILLAAVAGLVFVASVHADPILPWRHQIDQRLRDQNQLIGQLIQNQKQTPPNYQVPIPGDPKQLLPIPGEPKQQLPIPGDPKQQVPIPGDPKQPLPVPGDPKQPLPVQPPPFPPNIQDGPQPYAVRIRALTSPLTR